MECKAQERKLALPLEKIKEDLRSPIDELSRNVSYLNDRDGVYALHTRILAPTELFFRFLACVSRFLGLRLGLCISVSCATYPIQGLLCFKTSLGTNSLHRSRNYELHGRVRQNCE